MPFCVPMESSTFGWAEIPTRPRTEASPVTQCPLLSVSPEPGWSMESTWEASKHRRRCHTVSLQPSPSLAGISLGEGKEDQTTVWWRQRAAWPGHWPSCHHATCTAVVTQLPRIVSPSGSSCPGMWEPLQSLLRLQKVNLCINST